MVEKVKTKKHPAPSITPRTQRIPKHRSLARYGDGVMGVIARETLFSLKGSLSPRLPRRELIVLMAVQMVRPSCYHDLIEFLPYSERWISKSYGKLQELGLITISGHQRHNRHTPKITKEGEALLFFFYSWAGIAPHAHTNENKMLSKAIDACLYAVKQEPNQPVTLTFPSLNVRFAYVPGMFSQRVLAWLLQDYPPLSSKRNI